MPRFTREIALHNKLRAVQEQANLPADTDMMALLVLFVPVISPEPERLAAEAKADLTANIRQLITNLPPDRQIPELKEAIRAAAPGLEITRAVQNAAREVYRELGLERHKVAAYWARGLTGPQAPPANGGNGAVK
jgi:hypothetical protein